ncbi:uncharacterized protein LOC126909747 isoform X1 [Daktulosphaira vitifoliae]|nr:uncharacterized protein LOC126909747 isoform X1 [Daktulosphaira vitifoliae]
MVDEINAVFQKWTSVLENILTTQDRFFACRIDLYKIREQRHKIKIEVYDDNMNVIVPDKEKQLYRKVSQLETKLLEAYRNVTLSKKTLNEILVKSLKFKNDIKKKFEEYVNIQKRKERREKMKASMSVRIAKSVRSFGPSMSRYLGMSKSNLLKKQSISDEDGLSVEFDAVSTI